MGNLDGSTRLVQGLRRVRCQQCELRKVSAVAFGVTRQQRNSKHTGVAANQEVGQHVRSHAPGAAIKPEGLHSPKRRGFGQLRIGQVKLREFEVACGLRGESDRELGIDGYVGQQGSTPASRGERFAGPVCPLGAARRDIDEDIGIDERQTSLRVIAMTSSVVNPSNGRLRLMSSSLRRYSSSFASLGSMLSMMTPPSARARTFTRSPGRIPAASRTVFGNVT